jgi:hypothetical protein
MPLFCKACGDRVRIHELRDHLQGHNPNADKLSWEEVRNSYYFNELVDPVI